MAFVVNKAEYHLNLKDENGKDIYIPYDNQAYNVSDYVYFKYKELLHLVKVKYHNPPMFFLPTTSQNINRSIQPIDDIVEIKFDKQEDVNVPVEKTKPPLKGVRISKKKKASFSRTGSKKKTEIEEKPIETKVDQQVIS